MVIEDKDNRRGRYIDRFDVLLLDMGQTFMFNVDRFDMDDGLGQTYSRLGGRLLSGSQAYQILSAVFEQMMADSKIEGNYENFASVSGYLKKHQDTLSLPAEELSILEKVFTEHEVGVIPDEYVNVLRKLCNTHKLGIISDIWSESARFYCELEKMGVKDMFNVIVFSSDIGVIKPSGKIFAKAMKGFDVDVSKVAYIGDSLRRDVAGAKNFGISAIWIQQDQALDCDGVKPDLIVNDLCDLLD